MSSADGSSRHRDTCRRRWRAIGPRSPSETAPPTPAAWQRDLALSHRRVAMVLVRQGQRERALGAFRQGREIITKLKNLGRHDRPAQLTMNIGAARECARRSLSQSSRGALPQCLLRSDHQSAAPLRPNNPWTAYRNQEFLLMGWPGRAQRPTSPLSGLGGIKAQGACDAHPSVIIGCGRRHWHRHR
jgi:hypothetical protein